MQTIKFTLLTLFLFALSACGGTTTNAPANATPAQDRLTKIELGVGFVPNVQFAPYYVAQAKGFYADEGLDVSLEHGNENDFVTLTAQGERQFAVASGDQVILARSQGLPVKYVMKWYQRYPVAIAALQENNLNKPEDLAGRSLGIPGQYGASFVAWKALAYAANLDESRVDLREIGFTQAEALSEGVVDAAVVYVANEPVQLQEAGQETTLIEVNDYINLVSNGIVTNEKLIAENPELVQAMIRASQKGLAYTLENPEEAFDIARSFIPEMTDADAPTQRAVLDASLNLWQSEAPGLSNPEAWQDSVDFMVESGLIGDALTPTDLYTNQFIEQ